jgi:hypothetical protein
MPQIQERLATAGRTLARIGAGALVAGCCAGLVALPFAVAHDMRAAVRADAWTLDVEVCGPDGACDWYATRTFASVADCAEQWDSARRVRCTRGDAS